MQFCTQDIAHYALICTIYYAIKCLSLFCKNTAFSDVKLNGELGQRVEESGMYGYQFKIDRENLDTSLAMTGKVSLMNKDVAFSIKVDLSKSALIGNNAINKDDGASGNN